MKQAIHGGDIYRNDIKIDFSVNTNPLGIPEKVKEALQLAVTECEKYPDIEAEKLTKAIAKHLDMQSENIVCGNGASELFVALVHACQPKKVLIPVPAFLGYEKAAATEAEEILYYEMREENDFALDEGFIQELTEDTDMVFLANPNNPVGNVVDEDLLSRILKSCKEKHITLVVDECFLEFCEDVKQRTLLSKINQYDNLVVVRAFTKIYAIPGVRLGYLVSSNEELKKQIRKNLAEWNISTFAQSAGVAALSELDYVNQTVRYIKREQEYIAAEIERLNRENPKYQLQSIATKANFMLIKTDFPLYEKLLEKGILIRSCNNFKGFESYQNQYYRIAIKSHEENETLIRSMEQLFQEEIEFVLPGDIEKRSFEIISKELTEQGIELTKENELVIKRVIHTSADFEYAKTLLFSDGVVAYAKELIRQGADIVTDTNMGKAGINKKVLARYGGEVHCFMADEEVAKIAKERQVTRAMVSMEMAAKIEKPVIFAVGNAPTALIRLNEMIADGSFVPAMIIGVPVGFVNVVQAKELILKTNVPYIVNRGRKGGSNVAAAICNAILYEMGR